MTDRAKAFVEWWCDELKMRYGIGYSPSWRTDVPNVAAMIKDFGPKMLHRMAMQYMENPKRYSTRADVTLGVLFRYRNNILQKIELGDDPRSRTPGDGPKTRIVTVRENTFVIENTPKWAKQEHQIRWRIDWYNSRLKLNLMPFDRERIEKDIAYCEYLLQKVAAPADAPTVDPVEDLVDSVVTSCQQQLPLA